MGYNTWFNLEIKECEGEPETLIEQLRSECDYAQFAIDDEGNGSEEAKWYDHQDDMRAFSQKHPTAIFALSGKGEDSEDMWIEYYHAGKMQRCNAIITYDEMDLTKMD